MNSLPPNCIGSNNPMILQTLLISGTLKIKKKNKGEKYEKKSNNSVHKSVKTNAEFRSS